MKKIVLFGLFTCSINCFAQKTHHNFYIAPSISAIGLNLDSAALPGPDYKGFNDPQAGFDIGYRYVMLFSKKFTLSAGVEFNVLNYKFKRPYYNEPFWVTQNHTSIFEKIRNYRLLIPVHFYYNLLEKKKTSVFLLAGGTVIFLNRIQRTADYQIPGPPFGFVDGKFEGNQKINFSDDNSIGAGYLGGIGTAFQLNDHAFLVELLYKSDLSKSTFYTLHNIEGDSFFYGKVKTFQLKLAYAFSLKK